MKKEKPKCSVLSKSADKKESCLTKKQLKKVTKLHNKEYCKMDKKCKLPLEVTKPVLLKNLKKSLDIKDEERLAKFNFIKKDKMTYYTLKKLMYKKRLSYRKNGWLTTYDIDDVMVQYALRYNFSYRGAVPSDYFLTHSFKRSYPAYLIFNTDPSHMPGSHWVSMVMNEDHTVDYFDSNGMKPNRYIKKFLDNQGCKLRWYNKKPLQNKDGLCGVYAMYFLITKAKENCICLNNKTADRLMVTAKKEYFQ